LWSTDTRWFDVAAFTTLWVVLVLVFGHFTQHQPLWRRLAKFATLMVLLLVLVEVAGRRVAYGVLGLLLVSGASVHFAVLSKRGINGWTGEPRDRFEALLREIESRGEARMILGAVRDLLSRRG
jgi:hypothetical protein